MWLWVLRTRTFFPPWISAFGLPLEDKARFHVPIHEDNVDALLLGQLEPRCMTSCSKYYAVKYHWFANNWHHEGWPSLKLTLWINLEICLPKGLAWLHSSVYKNSWWVGSLLTYGLVNLDFKSFHSVCSHPFGGTWCLWLFPADYPSWLEWRNFYS